MTDDPLSLDNQLCFAIYAASHAFTKAYRPLLTELGLTYPQYLVMLVLWEKRAASVTEIGAALGLDTGTLSPLLKRLEKTGYIRRERSREDERQVMIALTTSGVILKTRAQDVLKTIGQAIGCDLQQMQALMDGLRRVRRNLEEA
ncbi:MarR family winged helix-turn-helix transcriptional regulator [Rhizobium sp. G21]|uniref:MarR family winged helix-turn-helix transcriptional regulator n=1 Tax=Rhizobium sp. G21 TaxID=2758439 RepID=UPI001601DED8|nr:MarR family transcriptional regulator [Rhizobium sp. G21]MBB1250680.1 MarR family transcriptional regulator [Rhizobium sp. G21]